jgi:hypothetical protein
MRRIGVYSVNDIRHKEGENSIGAEGDIRIVEANMQTIDQLMAQKEPEIYDYHIKAGIPTLNEVRERLALPPVPGGDKPANQLNPGQDAETHDAPTKVEPKPPALPGKSSDESGSGAPVRDLISETLVAIFASVFEGYGRSLAIREAELRRLGVTPHQLADGLAEERVRLRPDLLHEARAGIDTLVKVRPQHQVRSLEVMVLMGAEALDYGHEPRVTAERMIAALMKRPKSLPEAQP